MEIQTIKIGPKMRVVHSYVVVLSTGAVQECYSQESMEDWVRYRQGHPVPFELIVALLHLETSFVEKDIDNG